MDNKERRIYVIGDIHGCVNTFKKMIQDSLHIERSDEIYLLGDYIDRGPNSKGVVDYILQMQDSGYSVHCLMGNHEKMLLDSLQSRENDILWYYNGSKSTLDSFGVIDIRKIDNKYINFFKTLHYYFELEDFILVHAGLNFDIDDPFKDKQAMLWIRDERVDISKIENKRIVCGHTPVKLNDIRASLDRDKVLLDGGCVYYDRHNGLGNLCALELNTMKLTAIENIDNY